MTTVDFYDKDQSDALLDAKADKSTTYTKTEVDTALGAKANSADVYTKSETDTLLSGKLDNDALDGYATENYVKGLSYIQRYTAGTTTEVPDRTSTEGASITISEPGYYDVKVYMQGNVETGSLNVIGFSVDGTDTWLCNLYADAADTWRNNGSWMVHVTQPTTIKTKMYYKSPTNSSATFTNYVYATRIA